MQIQPYIDFSKGVQHGLGGQRVPLNGTIELTLRCPLTCAHCYNNLPMGDQQARSAELSRSEERRVGKETRARGSP